MNRTRTNYRTALLLAVSLIGLSVLSCNLPGAPGAADTPAPTSTLQPDDAPAPPSEAEPTHAPPPPPPGGLIQPSDLTYLGAFAYPSGDEWAYSARALA
ncbi:MAG: hypothetical protein DRJ03_30510, partial [Chloroflexi bacterium]